MSIGALSNFWNKNFYGGNSKTSAKGGQSALNWLADTAPELMNPGQGEKESGTETTIGKKAPLSYSRRITANFKSEELSAVWGKDGEVCYSYQASMQRFEVLIHVNGEERNYLIKGTDKDGNAFEKEFDPYKIDPANADYTEFAALCVYIQKTDKYADSIMRDFAQPDNILEKQNYVGILGTWAVKQAEAGNIGLFDNARRLFLEIHRFMDERFSLSGSGSISANVSLAGKQEPVTEELLDLLFKEKDDRTKKVENRYWEQNFEQIGARAPESVKQAWMEAAEAAGVDGMGASKNGKLTHISQFMVQKVLRQWRGENADDILGSSVQSAIRAVNEALYALEHPLAPHHALTPEAAKGKENEKKFYLEFLKRLEGLQDNPDTEAEAAKKEVKKETEDKNVNKSKTDIEVVTQPDGSKILLIKTNIGGMETLMSVELSKPSPFSDKQKDAPADTEGEYISAVLAQDGLNHHSET